MFNLSFLDDLLKSDRFLTLLGGSARIILVVVLGWIGWIFARLVIDQARERLIKNARTGGESYPEAERRADTLINLVRAGSQILIFLTIALIVLQEMGINIGPVIASAGVLGLAVGFGAQSLVKDVISGFFFILENQVRVGDVVTINGSTGLVEEVNFRTLIIRDVSGTVHIFPNGNINTLSNQTKGWSAYVMDIGVAYKQDLDKVMETMLKVGTELKTDPQLGAAMLGDLEIFGVDSFGDSAVNIKCRIKTRPNRQWDVGREYRKRLKNAFERGGIEFPTKSPAPIVIQRS